MTPRVFHAVVRVVTPREKPIDVNGCFNPPARYKNNLVDKAGYFFLDDRSRLLAIEVDYALGTRYRDFEGSSLARIVGSAGASDLGYQPVEKQWSTGYTTPCIVN
jgi:hypothetical protein